MNKELEEKIAELNESLKGAATLRAERDAARAEKERLLEDYSQERAEREDLAHAYRLLQAEVERLSKGHIWDIRQENEALKAELSALRAEIEVGDKIIADRNRLLDALPCPVHGQCVPHALEEIERLKAAEGEAQRLLGIIREIDRVSSVPAAEYVPAFGDVFDQIDLALGKKPRQPG